MSIQMVKLDVCQHNQAGNFFMSSQYWAGDISSSNGWVIAGDVINSWNTAFRADWLALQGNDVVIDYYRARRILPSGSASNLKLEGDFGTAAGLCNSAGLCCDIVAQNDNASNRPAHIYLGGVYEGSVQGDQWVASFLTKVNTLITAFLGGIIVDGQNFNWVAYERKTRTQTPVFAAQVNPKPTLLNKRTLPLI